MEESLKPDRLLDMLKRQDALQCDTYGHDLLAMSVEQRLEYIRTNVLALQSELHEALGETGWKPWATNKHINTKAYVGELVDAWHFLMNLLLATSLDPDHLADMLYEGYLAKSKKNVQRQEDGYDGVSTKCPRCKRAFDDDAVKCNDRKVDNVIGPVLDGYCDVEKKHYYWITTAGETGKIDRRMTIVVGETQVQDDQCPRCGKQLGSPSSGRCYRFNPKFISCATQGITTHIYARRIVREDECPEHKTMFISIGVVRKCSMGDEWSIVNGMFRPVKS